MYIYVFCIKKRTTSLITHYESTTLLPSAKQIKLYPTEIEICCLNDSHIENQNKCDMSITSRWFGSGKLGQNSEKVYQMQGLQLAIVIYRAWYDSLYQAWTYEQTSAGDTIPINVDHQYINILLRHTRLRRCSSKQIPSLIFDWNNNNSIATS